MFTFNCNGRLLIIDKPIVMGIINITADSFYAESRKTNVDAALVQAKQMAEDGAIILDLGAQSTRPGAEILTADEEIKRLVPVIKIIKENLPQAFISIDTFYAATAKDCVEAGADIINDITGGHYDKDMLATIAALQVPYVCMHMKGMPANMQQLAHYEDLTKEVIDYFIERLKACSAAGIKDIVIDPGFGFAKNITHNFELLNKTELFHIFEKPLLVGLSRKSTVYKTLGTTPENALNGTTVLNTIALQKGAHILRVHDVKEAVEAITLVQALKA